MVVSEAMNLPQVVGHVALSSVTVIAESLRLDMGFRALELTTHSRTYLLGVEDPGGPVLAADRELPAGAPAHRHDVAVEAEAALLLARGDHLS